MKRIACFFHRWMYYSCLAKSKGIKYLHGKMSRWPFAKLRNQATCDTIFWMFVWFEEKFWIGLFPLFVFVIVLWLFSMYVSDTVWALRVGAAVAMAVFLFMFRWSWKEKYKPYFKAFASDSPRQRYRWMLAAGIVRGAWFLANIALLVVGVVFLL